VIGPEKQRQRLINDVKYKSYDRGIERLKEAMKIVDPASQEEIEKHKVFFAAGYDSFRPTGSPFTFLELNDDEYNRFLSNKDKSPIRSQLTNLPLKPN
jgi:hypothetical protein